MLHNILAGRTDIGEHAHTGPIVRNSETERIGCIVPFRESGNTKRTRFYSFAMGKRMNALPGDLKTAVPQGALADEDRELKLFRQHLHSFDMIAVLVRYENSFPFLDIKAETFHPLFRFPAGNTGIHQYRVLVIAHIVAMA